MRFRRTVYPGPGKRTRKVWFDLPISSFGRGRVVTKDNSIRWKQTHRTPHATILCNHLVAHLVGPTPRPRGAVRPLDHAKAVGCAAAEFADVPAGIG
jgi:hypothetical protein